MSTHRDSDHDSDTDESFVNRWSRRKQDARPDTDAAVEPLTTPVQKPAETARPVLTDADMPDPDSLQADSDFAAFMSPGVSEQLRAVALRRLFHMTGLHTPDGLDDYDEDFTQLPALGDTLTHDMRRVLAREARTREPVTSSVEHQSVPQPPTADTEHLPATDQREQLAANPDSEAGDETPGPV